jgi:carboxyl-terminal processing protease
VWAWQDPLYKLGRNIEIYGRVLQELALNYVDEPDLDKLTTEAIEKMLATLDPYTNFIARWM